MVPERRYCIRSAIKESSFLQRVSLWRIIKLEQFQLRINVLGHFIEFRILSGYRRMDSVDTGKMERRIRLAEFINSKS